MMLIWILPVLVAGFVLSYVGTGIVRRMAVRRAMMDIPGARSSHERPTPRGGGAAFSILLLLAVTGCLIAGAPHKGVWIALLGGGTLVAVVGWLDDRFDLSSYVRLGLYAAAAVWSAAWLQGFPVLSLGFADLRLGWVGYPFSWAVILAFTNIYNFMDGIDGLAAGEGASVSLVAGALLLLVGEPHIGWLLLGLAVLLLGFLRWNWHPAKVFMGDVGSNLLGFTFATLALATGRISAISVWVWACLLGVFLVDGFLTFSRRLAHGLPPHQAHRTHAYQGAVQMGYSHAQTTSVILVLNGVLAGVGYVILRMPQWAMGLTFVAWGILTILHVRYSPLGRSKKDSPGAR